MLDRLSARLCRLWLNRLTADCILLSPGKAGRTWLKYLLARYLSSDREDSRLLEGSVTHRFGEHTILSDHADWSAQTAIAANERWPTLYRIPKSFLRRKRIIFLYRDPRDTTVSMYYQVKFRSKKQALRKRYEAFDADSFVFDKDLGISPLVDVLNTWSLSLEQNDNVLWLSYEDLRTDSEHALERVLRFLGHAPNSRQIRWAVQESSLSKMRQKASANEAVPKARKGKVGGYNEELKLETVEYCNREIQRLRDVFGYKIRDK